MLRSSRTCREQYQHQINPDFVGGAQQFIEPFNRLIINPNKQTTDQIRINEKLPSRRPLDVISQSGMNARLRPNEGRSDKKRLHNAEAFFK